MIPSPQNRYLNNSVQTATPGQLLLMLFDGCMRFCKLSIQAIDDKDYSAAHTNLYKAQAIINELIVSLDKNIPISAELERIYEYMHHLLIQANLKKSREPIQEVLGYLVEFKETWSEASKKAYAQAAGVANG